GTVKPLEPGNIQWYGRDKVPMGKGGYGTVYSFSREEDGKEVLVPQIYDGKLHSQEEAWQHYKQTGQHMGKFKNASDADYFGQKYHEDAAAGKYDKAISAMPQEETIRIRLNGKTGTIPKKRLQFYLDQGAFVLPDQKPPTPKNVGAPTSDNSDNSFIESMRGSMGFDPKGGFKSDIKDIGTGLKHEATDPLDSVRLLLQSMSKAQ